MILTLKYDVINIMTLSDFKSQNFKSLLIIHALKSHKQMKLTI